MSEDLRKSLLVFADDWKRHPSSCQHLVGQILIRRKVLWVNTIGTRPPGLDLATARRGVETIRRWCVREGPGDGVIGEGDLSRPRVVSPRMWPWFRSQLDRRLNRRLLLNQLMPRLRSLPNPPVAVTTIPIVADLIGDLPVRRWVYYCVDDFGEWPGLDGATLRRMERQLVGKVDRVIAVSETLRGRLASMGREAELLTHGVDLDHWSVTGDPPGCLRGLERPLILFFGVIDRRMDVRFLECLASDLATGTIVLVGPEADPDPALTRMKSVVRRPPMPFSEMPSLAAAADVLIMPYDDLPVTRAMQPLKLKEYLASGRPAVARDLPANREWSDCLDLISTPEGFSAAVRQRLATGLPEDQKVSRARLAGESWAAKALLFENWLDDDLKSRLTPVAVHE